MKNLILFSSIISFFLLNESWALKRDPNKLYKKVFPSFHITSELDIKDTISEEPINTIVLKILDKKGKILGYARELVTTTGCNSECLPIFATLFYGADKKFLAIKSRKGLTKKDHKAFTELDYQKLELLLIQNPKEFTKVAHPKMMVDAITSETLKEYKPVVIEKAAYTTLRMNLYNQDTLKFLKSI